MRALGIMRIALDINTLDEENLDTLVTGIVENAPSSPIYAVQAVKDCVTTLSGAQTKYKASHTDVVATSQKLDTQKATEAENLAAMITAVLQLKGLVETTAKKSGDVTSMGFVNLEKLVAGSLVPPGIDVFYPKTGHGRAKVSAQESGTKKRYEAQICTDAALTTWTDLDGYGKSHWLKGYKSGTALWVRYRTVRGHDKSEWSAATAVTIP